MQKINPQVLDELVFFVARSDMKADTDTSENSLEVDVGEHGACRGGVDHDLNMRPKTTRTVARAGQRVTIAPSTSRFFKRSALLQ
jgi:hypothetical protein